jgi:hypothetical protein
MWMICEDILTTYVDSIADPGYGAFFTQKSGIR